MDEKLWGFIDAAGAWVSKSYGMPRMAGRVLGWLLVCDPAEQTAAQTADALDASKGSISGATGMLVRFRLVDRLHVRGERADRFRLRPEAWDEQLRDRSELQVARALLAKGLEALAGEPPGRRARLEALDEFYAWWQSRVPDLWDEWQQYKQTTLMSR
ncbi:MAG TPA: MarR family transcriptional regulator [Candidatus Micrarchaeia archaeon]|nr:MarR family transcriptional regulator [Candidatus Micrarchaeia archaeon]